MKRAFYPLLISLLIIGCASFSKNAVKNFQIPKEYHVHIALLDKEFTHEMKKGILSCRVDYQHMEKTQQKITNVLIDFYKLHYSPFATKTQSVMDKSRDFYSDGLIRMLGKYAGVVTRLNNYRVSLIPMANCHTENAKAMLCQNIPILTLMEIDLGESCGSGKTYFFDIICGYRNMPLEKPLDIADRQSIKFYFVSGLHGEALEFETIDDNISFGKNSRKRRLKLMFLVTPLSVSQIGMLFQKVFGRSCDSGGLPFLNPRYEDYIGLQSY